MTLLRRSLTAAAVALALLVLAVPAGAVPAGPAYIRLAHLSPDTPPVDVYVASVADPGRSVTVAGVGYGAVSPYKALDAGSYVVSMRPAGSPTDSPPVVSTTVDAAPGGAYTIAGLGRSADLGLSVLTDRLDMPAPGRATVRVINASVTAPVVDLGPPGGPVWARDVRFGTATDYVDVPLGTWDVAVTAAGATVATLPVRLGANSVYTVLLVDKGGALAVELYRDSTGSGVVPGGSVATGFGGTAAGGGVALPGVIGATLLGGLLAALLSARRARER